VKITTVRRISQLFFVAMAVWFALAASSGNKWFQMQGWPVNWLLELDPLSAVTTLLSTRTLYAGLAWGLVTLALTMLLGRFFCGWVCPMGAIHQFAGWLGKLGRSTAAKIQLNRYSRWQTAKYYVLLATLAAALAGPSLLSGLLDPLPMLHRTLNLVALPLADSGAESLWPGKRFTQYAGLVGGITAVFVLLNLWIPRFFCRFVCPTGALLGLFSRFAIFRVGKTVSPCHGCVKCEQDCEGACEPAQKIRPAECVLCLNCLHECPSGHLRYQARRSASGEVPGANLSRRGMLASLAAGAAVVPVLRLANRLGANNSPQLIRPPGALDEERFLARCIKCGQCMRVCPSNVLQPAGLDCGIEALWTPVLNNRIGTSGCLRMCVSCGSVCPTAAIRPITHSEKLGINDFAAQGPIRLGTAFVDRGRCLPWAMNTPCIVCQENCPVSPKAIYVEEVFSSVRFGEIRVVPRDDATLEIRDGKLHGGEFGTGDFHVLPVGADASLRRAILANTAGTISLAPGRAWPGGEIPAVIQVRLQRPVVDMRYCVGCGICEHECPVSGRRAIRVTSENETRSVRKSLSL
jgi:polyferredoxin